MNIVDPLAATTDVLRVQRTDGIPSRPDAQDEGFLTVSRDPGHELTFALTGSVYSVLRWPRKWRTDCLCSCCKSPCTIKGDAESPSFQTVLGTSFRTNTTLVPAWKKTSAKSTRRSFTLTPWSCPSRSIRLPVAEKFSNWNIRA